MKLQLAIFTLSLAAGWICLSLAFPSQAAKVSEERHVPERISLLNDVAIPDDEVTSATTLDDFEQIESIITRIYSASPEELRRWLSSLRNVGGYPDELIQIIITQLAFLEPNATFAYLRSQDLFTEHLTIVAAEWMKISISAALDAVIEMAPEGGVIFSNLMGTLDADSLNLVYQDLLKEDFGKTDPYKFFGPVLFHLHNLDPELGTKYSIEMETLYKADDSQLRTLVSMTAWYDKDPEAAFQWAVEHPNPAARNFAMLALAKASVNRDGVQGLDRVWEHLDDEQRQEFGSSMDDVHADVNELVEWIDENVGSSSLHGKMMASMLKRQEMSPEGMVKIVSQLDPDYAADDLSQDIRRISNNWAFVDSEGLQRWMNTLSNSSIQTAAQMAYLRHLSREDPFKAIAYWEQRREMFSTASHFGSVLSRPLMSRLAELTGSDDPQVMLSYLPDEWQAQVGSAFAEGISEDAPEKAIRLLEMLPEGERRDEAIQRAVGHWAMEEPHLAAEWISELGEGKVKELAALNVTSAWANLDLESAQNWVQEQPSSPSRDRAVEQIATSGWFHYPAETLALAQSVTHDETRDWLLQEVITNLARHDPELAAQHVETAGLGSDWSEIIEQERAIRSAFTKSHVPPSKSP